MNIILIANLSANGKVLLAENPAHAAPPEALGFFIQKIIAAGNAVIGRKTFDVLQMFPGGVKQLFPNVEIVILSTSDNMNTDFKVVDSTEKAIGYLTKKGFKEIIVGGGAGTYNAFLEKDLVTDIYFNFIPMIISDGGVIGIAADLNLKFNLKSSKQLTDNIAQVYLSK